MDYKLMLYLLSSITAVKVDFTGELSMLEYADQAYYGVGSELNFNFGINFTTYNTTNLTIDIRGDSLQFGTDILQVFCTWNLNSNEDLNGTSSYTQGFPNIGLEERLSASLNVYSIEITDLVEAAWLFNGNCSSVVAESAGPGSLLRGIIDMTFIIDNETFNEQCVSNYKYTKPMIVNQAILTNDSLHLRELLTTQVTMTFTEGSTSPKVTVITPYDKTSQEVSLTLQTMTANSTHGFSDSDSLLIAYAPKSFLSTPRSYQSDIGMMYIPSVSKDEFSIYNDSKFFVKVTGRLEDFTAIENTTELDVGHGVNYGKELVWVSKTVKQIDVLDTRRPILYVSTEQTCVIAKEESFQVTVHILAKHTDLSNATAYNATMYFYAMNSMSHVDYTESKAQGYTTDWSVDGTTRIYNIERITFSTPMDISIIETIDMDSSMKNATDFTLMIEVVYTDRWNTEEYGTGLHALRLNLPLRCGQKVNWYYCNDDSETHQTCLACSQHGYCKSTIPGFNKTSLLSEGISSKIVCDAYYKYRPVRKETSCFREFNDGRPSQVLSSSVGVVLGVDTMTGHLYGIANNGHAYVRSHNKGKSWVTITPQFYDYVISRYYYLNATLEDLI